MKQFPRDSVRMRHRKRDSGSHDKESIPKALREQVWIKQMGRRFEGKCPVKWCQNQINVFDFQCGHNIPESRNGRTDISNLIPLCARCNVSMSNQYTIDEWNKKFAAPRRPWWKQFFAPCA